MSVLKECRTRQTPESSAKREAPAGARRRESRVPSSRWFPRRVPLVRVRASAPGQDASAPRSRSSRFRHTPASSDRVATDLEGRRRVVPRERTSRASRAGFEKAPRFASADSRAPPPGLESTMEAISLRPGGAGVSLRPGGAGAAAGDGFASFAMGSRPQVRARNRERSRSASRATARPPPPLTNSPLDPRGCAFCAPRDPPRAASLARSR
jgi:hypothetical protein